MQSILRNLRILAALPVWLLAPPVIAQISFGPSQEIVPSVGYYIHVHKVVDLDGDGDLDVIAAEESGVQVARWTNDGNGVFSKNPDWRWGTLFSGVIAIEDWDGDGLPDLWLRVDSPWYEPGPPKRSYHIARNDGTGIFLPPQIIHESTHDDEGDYDIVADLNGDGRLDILNNRELLISDNAGMFTIPSRPVPTSQSGGYWDSRHEVQLFDHDGDGLLDIFASDWHEGEILIFRNLGEAGLAAPFNVLPDFPDYLADFAFRPSSDGPGNYDLEILSRDRLTGSKFYRVFRISPGSPPVETLLFPLPTTDGNEELSWDSLVRDVVSDHGFIVSSQPANPDQPWGALLSIVHKIHIENDQVSFEEVTSFKGLGYYPQVEFHELNGDEISDLLLLVPASYGTSNGSSNQIRWHEGLAEGGFSTMAREILIPFADSRILSISDIDHDGDTDLLINFSEVVYSDPPTNPLLLLKNPGNGRDFQRVPIPLDRDAVRVVAQVPLEGPFLIHPPGTPEFLVHAVAEKPSFLVQTFDFTIRYPDRGTLRFEWMVQDKVTGVFHLRPLYSTTDERLPAIVTYADWDNDGIKDILFEGTSTYSTQPEVKWLRGTGTGFAKPQLLIRQSVIGEAFDFWQYRDVGTEGPFVDMDRDGHLDLFHSMK